MTTVSTASLRDRIAEAVAVSLNVLSGNSTLSSERFMDCLEVIILADLKAVLGGSKDVKVTITDQGIGNYSTRIEASDADEFVDVVVNHTRNCPGSAKLNISYLPAAEPHLLHQIYAIVHSAFRGEYHLEQQLTEFIESMQRHIRIQVERLVPKDTLVKVGISWSGPTFLVGVEVFLEEKPLQVHMKFHQQVNIT